MEEEKTVIQEFIEYAKEYLPDNEEAFESAVYDRIHDILNDTATRRNAGFLGYEITTETSAEDFFESFKIEVFEELEDLGAEFDEDDEDLIEQAIQEAAKRHIPSTKVD